jgi:pyruvate formate lyase activating enzyme
MPIHPARFYQKLSDDRLQCRLCPRGCVLKPGERGFCFGRQNIGGELVLTTYGKSSGFAVDPIEKKPLYHFLPGSEVLSFGTIGCNLGCNFCQNWRISRAREELALREKAGPEDIARRAKEAGIPSVAFTYNEPIVFAEYVMDTAEACHRLGVKTVGVTAGYITKFAQEDFFRDIDAVNVDLKAFRDDFYKRLCEASIKPVLDTLVYLKQKTKVWLEVTNLIIPGENDSEEEITEMCQWIAAELGRDVPLHFSAFHPDHQLTDKAWTPAATLRQARKIALDCGIKFVYTGNVRDDEGSTTHCPGCGKAVIERSGFLVTGQAIRDGKCASCGVEIAGVFA